MMNKTNLLKPAALIAFSALFLFASCGASSEETANNSAAPANEAAAESPSESAATNAPANENAASDTNTNGVTKNEQGDEIRTERVSFAKGASSAAVKGTVKGYDVIDYIVNAQKGQTMSVSLKSSSRFAYFNIRSGKDGFAAEMDVDPKPMDVTNWKGALPKSGDFYIRVYLVRAEARRDGKADFTLNIAVTGGGSNESAALPGMVTYSCSENLEIYATLKNGGERIEVEVGDTLLRLNRTRTGGGSTYADKGEKNTFWINGDDARLSFRGEDYTCKIKGS